MAWQVPTETSRVSAQGSATAHSLGVGQAPGWPAAMAVSHVSPAWMTPSPQLAEQSGSVDLVAPDGQQPSARPISVIGGCAQEAVQALPLGLSLVQATRSSQLGGGQAPWSPARMATSQVSPGSTRPLPQRGLVVVPASGVEPVPASAMQVGLPPQLRGT
jgi:hypothetical protein